MLEHNGSAASELLAPAEKTSTARGVTVAPELENDIFVALRMPQAEPEVREEFSIFRPPGAINIIHGLSDVLSGVIRQGKAALMKKNAVGFLAEGFDGMPIRELVDAVATTIEVCKATGEDSSLPINERVAAITFAGALEDFQYCFMGLDPESLGRSDALSLLPELEKFKQICMQFELELLIGYKTPGQE